MQIKNKIYLNRYLIGTFVNILWPLLIYQNIKFVICFLIFILAILVNQYFMMVVAADLIGIDKNDTFIPTPIMAILKLLVLAGAFYFVFQLTESVEHVFVIYYIAQLVVFTLSLRMNIE